MQLFITDRFSKQLESTVQKNNNVVLDGLYSWDEFKILKDKFKDDLTVISIVVDKNKRYERLEKRNIRALSFKKAEERDITIGELVDIHKELDAIEKKKKKH